MPLKWGFRLQTTSPPPPRSSAPQLRPSLSRCPVPSDRSQLRRPPIGCLRPRSGIAGRSPDLVLGERNRSAAAAPGAERRARGAPRSGGDPRGRGPGGEGEGTRAAPPSPRTAPNAWALRADRPGGRGRAGAPELATSNAWRGDRREDVSLPPRSRQSEAARQPSSLRPTKTVAVTAAAAHAG